MMDEPEPEESEQIERHRRTPESMVALALIAIWVKWPRGTSASLPLKDVRREYAQLTGTRLSDVAVGQLLRHALNVIFGIPIISAKRQTNQLLLVSRDRIDRIARYYGLTDLLTEQTPPSSTDADLHILEVMWALPSKRRFPVQ